MPKPKKPCLIQAEQSPFNRVVRPPSMVAQVEQVLRQAIVEGSFPNGKLPTEVELAEQLGVSRETVRLAAEALQRDGLLVKIRHRGTFTRLPNVGKIQATQSTTVGYLQTEFENAQGDEEVANCEISGRMLQGAVEVASSAGFQLIVTRTTSSTWRKRLYDLVDSRRLRGLICASYQEEKMLRRLNAMGLPTVLIDEDTTVAGIHSVRDDSFAGAVDAIQYLVRLGHQRIAYAHWVRAEMNPSRPLGYRKAMREAGLNRRRHWELLTELTEAGARDLIDRLLALAPTPTALYCFNNTLASFVIEELRRRRIRVPEELSVMGAGGEEVPGLTCHQADWYQMGRVAMQILLRAIQSHEPIPKQHLRLTHSFRVGHTTSSPAINP